MQHKWLDTTWGLPHTAQERSVPLTRGADGAEVVEVLAEAEAAAEAEEEVKVVDITRLTTNHKNEDKTITYQMRYSKSSIQNNVQWYSREEH